MILTLGARREEETIANYVAELWKIVEEFCEYGAVLKDMLRDRLVCRISSKNVQCRLLQESALTFDKALEVALAVKTAHKDSLLLLGAKPLDKGLSTCKEEPQPPSSQPPVHRVSESKPQQRHKASSQSRYRCGGNHHSRYPCSQYKCHNCRKKGNLADVSPETQGEIGADPCRPGKAPCRRYPGIHYVSRPLRSNTAL